jgi:putative acetyltransferase
MTVRDERAGIEERSIIHSINEVAFGRSDEADLVDRLRIEGAVILSLVAERNGSLVGHILFSRMAIETSSGSVPAVALAPLAVLPEFQRQGIGGELIRHGLELLRQHGEKIVLVLGHPDYYPRFGFSSEKTWGLDHPFPPEAFMAIELTADALAGIRGGVKYPAPFGL